MRKIFLYFSLLLFMQTAFAADSLFVRKPQIRSSTSKTKKSSRFRSKIFGKQREEYCRIASEGNKADDNAV